MNDHLFGHRKTERHLYQPPMGQPFGPHMGLQNFQPMGGYTRGNNLFNFKKFLKPTKTTKPTKAVAKPTKATKGVKPKKPKVIKIIKPPKTIKQKSKRL